MTINADNYELYLFKYQEDMLSPEERRMVESFLAQHPEQAQEMALYDKDLHADTLDHVVYADKEALKKIAATAPKARIVPLHARRSLVASAACIALLVAGGLWWMPSRPDGITSDPVAMLPSERPLASMPHHGTDPALAVLTHGTSHQKATIQHTAAIQHKAIDVETSAARTDRQPRAEESLPYDSPMADQSLLAQANVPNIVEGSLITFVEPTMVEGNLITFVEPTLVEGSLITFERNTPTNPSEWIAETAITILDSPLMTNITTQSKQLVQHGNNISMALYSQSIFELAFNI